MAQTLRSLVVCMAMFAGLVGFGGAARATLIQVEPDLFPGADLTNAFAGVTLSNVGGPESPVISKEGFSIFLGRNIATTPTFVFGKIQNDLPPGPGFPGQSISKQWDVGAPVTTLGSLRADFYPLADAVIPSCRDLDSFLACATTE